jgi:hypothetical protein
MDSDELGMAAAMACVWAVEIRDDYGWNLFSPHEVVSATPEAIIKIGRLVRYSQKQGQQGLVYAVGGLVWSHTLRAALDPRLRGGAREIWSHVERGFPYAQESADLLLQGVLKNVGMFPDGFTPEVK